MALPIPPEAPVTSANFPLRSNIMLLALQNPHPRGMDRCASGSRWRAAQVIRFSLSKALQNRLDLGRRLHRRRGDVAVDALDEPRKDAARSDLDDRIDASRLHVQDALAPAHEARHLLDEEAAKSVGRRLARRRYI